MVYKATVLEDGVPQPDLVALEVTHRPGRMSDERARELVCDGRSPQRGKPTYHVTERLIGEPVDSDELLPHRRQAASVGGRAIRAHEALVWSGVCRPSSIEGSHRSARGLGWGPESGEVAR